MYRNESSGGRFPSRNAQDPLQEEIWDIESSYRKLKYTIGLSNYHSYKPEYVKQEIWANLIAYNLTEMLVNSAVIEKKETKFEYKVNFTRAARICKAFLRLTTEKDLYNVMLLLQKELLVLTY